MSKGVFWYLLLAFTGAWLPWEVAIRSGVPATSPAFQLFALPGAFAPAIAALIVRRWITREGFADAGLRLNLRPWRYYLFGWLLPLVVLCCILAEAAGLSIATPDLSAAGAMKTISEHLPGAQGRHLAPAHLPAHLWLIILGQQFGGALVFTPILWGEEFGWRGYLQLRICPDRPVRAAVVTGVIWAVWHYPLILRGYDYPEHPLLGALMFPVGTVLVSIIFGWLREATGSIWASSLAHSATNVIGGSMTVILFSGRGDAVLVGYLGVLAWAPLGLVAAWIVATGRLDGHAGKETASDRDG